MLLEIGFYACKGKLCRQSRAHIGRWCCFPLLSPSDKVYWTSQPTVFHPKPSVTYIICNIIREPYHQTSSILVFALSTLEAYLQALQSLKHITVDQISDVEKYFTFSHPNYYDHCNNYQHCLWISSSWQNKLSNWTEYLISSSAPPTYTLCRSYLKLQAGPLRRKRTIIGSMITNLLT